MSRVDSLRVAVWSAEAFPEKNGVLTYFELCGTEYRTLSQWSQEETRRGRFNLWLVGLKEFLACFVAGIAFMEQVRDQDALRLFFLDKPVPTAKRSLENALTLWLNTLYAHVESRRQQIQQIAQTPRDPKNWGTRKVSIRMKEHRGVCAVPKDGLLFDALTAHAVRAIASKEISFGSGEQKIAITETPQSNLFRGVELIVFPPTDGDRGYWAHVVSVSAATFPEKPGIHIVVRLSIRNWAALDRPDRLGAPARSLDVFVPDFNGRLGWSGYHHCSFAVQLRRSRSSFNQTTENPVAPVVRFDHQKEGAVLEWLRTLAGKPKLDKNLLLSPMLSEGSLCVLPRLAPGSGDRNLPGGSGVPFPDRARIVEQLDAHLEAAGFERAPNLSRVRHRGAVPVLNRGVAKHTGLPTLAEQSGKKQLNVVRALTANHMKGPLEFYVFHITQDTPRIVADGLQSYLGPAVPGTNSDGILELHWAEHLSIRIISSPADLLSQSLPTLAGQPGPGWSSEQLAAIESDQQRELNQTTSERMQNYILNRRGKRRGLACAILEMPETLRGRRDDPYLTSRQALAKVNCLAQVLLTTQIENPKKDRAERIKAAVRDCLRMFGVVPNISLDLGNVTLATIVMIQRDAEQLLGNRREAQSFPFAVRLRNHVIECFMLGESNWIPYAHAVLKVFSSDHQRVGRDRRPETVANITGFYADVLERLNQDGTTIVLVDSSGHRVPVLNNDGLAFDRLDLGEKLITPDNFPNLRIVRTSIDSDKLPYYYPEQDVQWPVGLWNWERQDRTWYALKGKAPSVGWRSKWTIVPRSLGAETNQQARVTGQLDEICVMFKQKGDDALQLARLVHALRRFHVQYSYDTRRPFPLHEAMLMGRSVTL
jgi:RNase H domain-containing protein/MID domain-containing protein/argonaute-like protein